MIRKLTLAVAVAAALSPLSVFALGLGDIHTQSSLNQRFKAEIDLLSVTRDELSDVRVELASSEAFAKAGLDRPYLLSALRFNPALSPDGRMVITVSSQDPIREPFLNFLVEVNWPKGRMMREYTVLLDPPVTLDRTPAPVQTPRLAAASERRAAPAVRNDSAVLAGSFPAPPGQVSGARNYGPVQPNDTLWQIADGMRLPDETIEQVMMALQRYNPDAFIQDNVNSIKAGKILRLPEDADVTTLSPRAARREFLAQTREWREERILPQAAAEAPVAQASPQGAETSAQVASVPKDRLQLISAKPKTADEVQPGEGSVEDASKIIRLEQELLLVREESESARQENEVLHSRISELETQISDIQRLLTLKNDQLAKLQTSQKLVEEKSGALEAEQKVADTTTAESAPQPETMGQMEGQAEKSVTDSGTIEEVDIESIVKAANQYEPAVQPPIVAETEAKEPVKSSAPESSHTSPVVESATTPSPAENQPIQTPAPATAEKPKPGGFLDFLTGNSTTMGIVGGVVVVLLGMLWAVMRRRRQAEAEFAESILVTPETEAEAVKAAGGSINEPSEETSFMSDFSPSDIDALQDETGEVDPLSEADVYIAYGRYQQAEELINQAIERFPEREELKYKLLEVYYAAKNKERFTELAEQLRQSGLEKNKPDDWTRIAGMGKELDPGNALFAAAAGTALGVGLNATDDEFDDLDLDLKEDLLGGDQATNTVSELSDEIDSLELSNLEDGESASLEGNLSLDSEFLNKIDDEQTSVAEERGEASDPLALDLSGLDDDSMSLGDAEDDNLDLSSTLDDINELSGLELTNNDGEIAEPAEADSVIGIEDSDSLDDLDLESLEKELELLSGDLDDTSDEKPVADVLDLPEQPALDDEPFDMDSTDEVTTKLDLARAYVDMGDADGAKSILEEVVTEGSDDQKMQAQELLQSLAS